MANLRDTRRSARREAVDERERLLKSMARTADQFTAQRMIDRALWQVDPGLNVLQRVRSGVQRHPLAILMFMAGAYLIWGGAGSSARRGPAIQRTPPHYDRLRQSPMESAPASGPSTANTGAHIEKEKAYGNNEPFNDDRNPPV
jgi:hypothetical protein